MRAFLFQFSKALNVFECMQKDEIFADAKTYETVLFGATRWGNFAEALKIVRDAFNLDHRTCSKNDKASESQGPHRHHHNRRRRSNQDNGRPRIPGFQMNTRNFKKLWSAMRDAGEFEVSWREFEL